MTSRSPYGMRDCPLCGCTLQFIRSVGVRGGDENWDAQADRWDCPEGHTFLIVETVRIQEINDDDKTK